MTAAPLTPRAPCRVCAGTDLWIPHLWQVGHVGWTCARCHPPAPGLRIARMRLVPQSAPTWAVRAEPEDPRPDDHQQAAGHHQRALQGSGRTR